jgi:predicted lipid-binding transport protein (Tim44 family)
MKFLSALALVLSLGLVVGVSDAEAKRIGGGKSTGMQRQGTTEKAPTATPAQTPGSPAAAAAPAGAAAGATAAAAASKRSWMGPLAGIAAGLGIAALASHLGFGEELASMLMLGLLAFAVIAVIGFVMRKRAAAQGGQNRMAYAGVGAGAGAQPGAPANRSFESALPAGGSSGSMIGAHLAEQPARSIPADFDVAGFVRNAKVQFIRLQAANDAGNLDDIRGFTTPEMFAELKMDLAERAGATQTTEVMTIEADVTDVAEDELRYVVSVRFTGTLREDSEQTTSFDEVWHLTKPRQGNGGWVLAGIQQVQ